MHPGVQPLCPGFGQVLATADLPPDTIAHVLRKYQARAGSASDFWASFTAGSNAAEGVGDDVAREMESTVRLSTVVGPDPPLLRRMHELRREGRWENPEDLAGFSFDDWCDVLEDVE